MKVQDCMTKEVVTVGRSTTLRQLIEVFRKYNFHTLPVVDSGNRLLGIVTFEDVLKVFQPYGSELSSILKTVPFLEMEYKEEDLLETDLSGEMGVLIITDDIMNKHFITIDPQTDINKAHSLMKMHNIARFAVSKNGILVGIISLFDIILAVFRERGVIQ